MHLLLSFTCSRHDRLHQYWSSINMIVGVLTLVAIAHSVEVDVVAVVTEEHQAEPRVEGVDRHNEEDAYNPSLLVRTAVVA